MLVTAATSVVVAAGSPVIAAPGDDDEGGSASLRKVLDGANKGFILAKDRLDASKKRQLALNLQLRDLEARHAELAEDVGAVASHAYRNGRLTGVSMLLESRSADAFWQRATAADAIARVDAKQLRRLADSRKQVVAARQKIATEVREQTRQLAVMAKRKEDAERALFASGGGQPVADWTRGKAPAADPWPGSGGGACVDDPTTSGCVTERTLHAYKQVKAAGFNHHVSCRRFSGSGEHPLGRACDWSAAKGGFENVNATGSDRVYGDKLALFLVQNASRLDVMYVIWFGKIWMPSTGLRSYSGCCAPNATHKNHVHMSML